MLTSEERQGSGGGRRRDRKIVREGDGGQQQGYVEGRKVGEGNKGRKYELIIRTCLIHAYI